MSDRFSGDRNQAVVLERECSPEIPTSFIVGPTRVGPLSIIFVLYFAADTAVYLNADNLGPRRRLTYATELPSLKTVKLSEMI